MPDGEMTIVTTACGEIGAITARTAIDIGGGEMDSDEAGLRHWRDGERDLTIARLRSAAADMSRWADRLESAAAATE